MLTPMLDPALANKAAQEIANTNMKEVYVNAAASFVAGLLLPGAIGTVLGASTTRLKLIGGLKMAGGMVAGMAIIQTATWGQRAATRELSLSDNESYDRLNENEANDWITIPKKPSDVDDTDQLFDLKEAYKNGNLVAENAELQSRIDKISGMSRQQLLRDPTAVQLLKDLKEGRFPEARAAMTRFNPKRINPSNLGKANSANRQNTMNNLKRFGGKSVSGILFFAPFLATYFSENARKSMAIAMEADISSQGDILANSPQS